MPKRMAERVVASLSFENCVPFNIEEIIESYGVIIEKACLTPNVNGLYSPGNPPIVVVNRNLHVHRARFTLAHELYHHLDYISNPKRSEVRFSSDNPNIERKANKFAAFLLMPEMAIRSLVGLGIHEEELADICMVSRQAMQNRLKELSIA